MRPIGITTTASPRTNSSTLWSTSRGMVMQARSEDGRVTLKGEAQASRAASEKLAEGRDTGSPAREDPSIV